MRIVTWNIHGWKSVDHKPNWVAVGEVLRAIQPDIVGLNEVFYPRRVEGSDMPALAALAEVLGFHFVFGPCVRWPAQNALPADAYGNAVLARWPIIASSAHHLTPKEEDKDQLLAAKEPRGLLEARILLPDQRTFTVYETHLDHTDEEARLIQLRVARTWLGRDRNRPHLLMGDFNALSLWDVGEQLQELQTQWPSKKGKHMVGNEKGPQVIAQIERAGYVDLFSRFGTPGQSTFPVPALPLRIDYIFASQALTRQVIDCRIYREADGVSDHRPLIAEIAPFS